MLRTHRQRVPAMMAVACVGMMVYGLAGAAPDGTELAPASCDAATSCVQPAAKSGDKATSTTAKGDKSSTGKDPCAGSSDGKGTKDGSKDTTTTTKDTKDGSKDTTTTTKDTNDGSKDTTTTTTKDTKDGSKDTTTTDGSGGSKDPTTTTTKGDSKDSTATTVDKKMTTAAVKGPTTDSTDKADSTSKGDSKSSGGKDGCDPAPDSGGKDSTTTTTRKSGDKSGGKDTTNTTDGKDRSTTSTTEKRDTVEPTTPSDSGDPGSAGSDSGSGDPGATPIEPQEAPPAYDSGPSDPGAAEGGDSYDMPDEGPVPSDEDEVAIEPMAAPGEAAPVLPSFGDGFYDGTGSRPAAPAKQRSRTSGAQQVASAPLVMSSSGYVQASPGVTESAAVSRNLAGPQSSETESAFPADIISTPKVFPTNRRDPLAAGALVLLIGVGRELFKAWRRQANNYWVA